MQGLDLALSEAIILPGPTRKWKESLVNSINPEWKD